MMSEVTDYIDQQSPQEKAALVRICEIVRKEVPNVTAGLSYGMPAFKYNDRPLIGFSVAKHHMSLYPFDPRVIAEIKPELDEFEVSKGVVRFTPDHEIPESIIKTMIQLRLSFIG